MRSLRSPERWLGLALVACAHATPEVTAEVATVDAVEASAPPAPPRALPALPLGSLWLTGDLGALRARRPVKFLLGSDDLPRLARDLAAVHPEAELREDGILVTRGTLPDAVEARHLAATFLVDADQPEIAELAAPLTGSASPDAIRARVQGHFEKRLYGEFWTASRAARTKSGDCSEHAVLTAAVARKLGIPARVVVGYVVLSEGEGAAAVGHAWAELRVGNAWVVVDATPLGDEERTYLIATELVDEGPSYALALFRAMGILRAREMRVVESPTAR